MVMPKRDDIFGTPRRPDFGLDILNDQMVEMLKKDNEVLKKAGSELAIAALRVATEYDGVHRLMLAVSAWSKALADEGNRGEIHKPKT